MSTLLADSGILEQAITARENLSRREGQHAQLLKQRALFEETQEAKARESEVFALASAFITRYSDEKESSVYTLVQELVSQGLTQVFDEDLGFQVVPKNTGSRFSIDFQIVSHPTPGSTLTTPVMEARGGGVAAVAGFLLQVVMILLSDAPRVLFLDETFAQVSAEYEPRLAEFLSQLVDEIGLQIVLVTHSDAFEDVSDASYRASLKGGATTFTRTK